MRSATLALAALLLLVAAASAQAMITHGTISSDGFAFLSRFCYHRSVAESGTLSLTVKLPLQHEEPDLSNLVLAIYDDEAGSWDTIMDNWHSWTCEQKVHHATVGEHHRVRVMNASTMEVTPSGYVLSFDPKPFQNEVRPRFWFFTLARCNGGFSHAEFRVHAQQHGETHWNREFSEEANGLNSLYLAFFFFLSVVVPLHLYSTRKLQQRLSYLHPMLRLFLLLLLVYYLSIFANLIHYGSYPNNGAGVPALHKLAEVCNIVSRCLFITLLLLLSKGWTISHDTLTHKWYVLGLIGSYLLLDFVRLIYSHASDDLRHVEPNKGVMALEILLNIIWVAFTAWFVYAGYKSYKYEANPHKKSMYRKIVLLFLPWMLLNPLISVAVFALSPWVRERLVALFNVGLTSLAYATLVFLFWNTRAEEYFALATPDVMQAERSDEDYAHL